MAVKLTVPAVTASLQGLLNATEEGTPPPYLVIYSGVVPDAASDSLSTQVALVTFTLDDPAWQAIANDAFFVYADVAPVTPVNADEDGTATFYRLYNGNDLTIVQGTISAVGGGGDAELSAVDIIAGIEVTVVSFRLRQRYQTA